MALIPKLDIPTKLDAGSPQHAFDARPVPVSARTRIATAGKVSAMTKVYEPQDSSDSDSEEDLKTSTLRVPCLPSLLDGKCGLTAKPLPPRVLNMVQEEEAELSELLSSSEDELLVDTVDLPSHRSLVPLTFRTRCSEAATISLSGGKAQRCAGASGLGAMAGASGGAVLGLVSGLLPAPLTMGLSVPINAGIGSLSGMLVGTAGGLVCQSMDVMEVEAVQVGNETHRTTHSAVLVKLNQSQPQELPLALRSTLLGTSVGASTGSALGAVLGAAAGLPPALLTFGLSVPLLATLGSSVGLCLGGLAGAGGGLLGGCALHRLKEN